MCGIIGYVGNKNAKDVIISGLYALEYRGYDSSGIAYYAKNKLKIIKMEGKVANLDKKIHENDDIPNIGIGHTRWATHGIPNEINAHPHKVGITTLVHNGIIENYVELKEKLKEIYDFKSETDTEVACALIDYYRNIEKSKIKALQKAQKHIIGSYAFAIMFDDEKDTIYVMRKDSPLIVAETNNEFFVASDIAAILSHTNEYYLLDQGDIAKISNKIEFYDKNLSPITKKINKYNGTLNDVMKNGFEV